MNDSIFKQAGRCLATAVTFLTRIPWLAKHSYPDGEGLARSLPYFPLVGGLVATLSFGAYWLVWLLSTQTMMAAVAALAAAVVLTGAFHEDGFADSCDGVGGGYSLERQLEIMRDSRIGSFAGVGLNLLLLAKFACLSALLPAWVLPALVCAHVLARFSVLPLAMALPYLREGEKKPITEGATAFRLALGLGCSLALTLPWVWLLGPLPILAAYALFAAVVLFAIQWLRSVLGGATGDLYGAVNQVLECLILGVFVCLQPA